MKKKFIWPISLIVMILFFCLYPSLLESYSRRAISTVTDAQIKNGGTEFYAIKRTNIDPNTSVDIDFGFVSRIVIVETPSTNTSEIVVDWLQGLVTKPSANSAGDDLLPAGTTITLDNFYTTGLSIISMDPNQESQTIYIRAHR